MNKRIIIIGKGHISTYEQRREITANSRDLKKIFNDVLGSKVIFEESPAIQMEMKDGGLVPSEEGKCSLLEGLPKDILLYSLSKKNEDRIKDLNCIIKTNYSLSVELDLDIFEGLDDINIDLESDKFGL